MKRTDSIWADGILTPDDYQVLRGAVVEAPMWGISGRDVISPKKVDAGLQIYGFQTITDVGDADTIKPGADFPGMNVDGTLTEQRIAKIGIAFNVTREDVLSARRGGLPIDTMSATHASQVVQKKENDVIWNGDTKFGITGIVPTATGAYSSGGWSGANDNPYDDVRLALAQVADAYSDRRMALVVNRDNYMDLLRKNTYTDMSYKTMIEQDLNIFPKMDVNYTSGTALLLPEGSDVSEIVIAEELDMEMDYENAKNQVYRGEVFVRSVPILYVPTAAVKITSIA